MKHQLTLEDSDMQNYLVTITDKNKAIRRVVLAGLSSATGLVSTSLLKGNVVTVRPTDLPVTHKNTYAAERHIETTPPVLAMMH